MNYNWNWGIFWDKNPEGTGTFLTSLISGLGWTISTALCAWVLALMLGTVVGALRTTPWTWVVRLGNIYVELFRNIPVLVQIFLWYFVLPKVFPAMQQVPGFVLVVLGLGFFTSSRNLSANFIEKTAFLPPSIVEHNRFS